MNPYLLLTIIGILAKLWAAYRLRQHWRLNPAMLMSFIFLITAYGQSLLELYGYYLLQHPEYNRLLALKLYYVFTLALLFIMPLLHSSLLDQRLSMLSTSLAALLFSLVSYVMMNTDYIITDVVALPYMLTRVKGDYYSLYTIAVISALLWAILQLAIYYRRSKDTVQRIKAANLLIAFIPITFVVLLILILMAMQISITAAGFAPILLAVYILVLYENLQRDRIRDLSTYLPWTKKAQYIRTITKPLRVYSKQADTCKDLPDDYKAILIDMANEMFDKQKDAAAWLGLTESQMSRIKKKQKTH